MSDQSTTIYLDGESLFFLGSELPLAMIDAWFGGAENFVDLMNKGLDAVTDWSSQSKSSLSNIDFSQVDALVKQSTSSNPTGEQAALFDALITAWAHSPDQAGFSPATAPVAAVSVANTAYAPVFSTLVDGIEGEILRDVAFDAQGNVYVTGGTQNLTGIPITGGNDYYNPNGTYSTGNFVPHDVFVQKYDPSGNLLWSTRVGGNNYDRAYAIEVDDLGSVYVAGRAGEGFYTTPGVLQENFGYNTAASKNNPYGKQDGFVLKLDASNGDLDWSTYFGGKAGEIVRDIDIGPDGTIHIAQTFVLDAQNQHITADAMQPTMRGAADNIYAQLSNDGTQLLYGTYIGGFGDTETKASSPSIIVDDNGDINMVMKIDAVDAPTTPGAFRTTPLGTNDYYLVKLDGATDGRTIKSATYFGTEGADYTETHQLAVDEFGNFIIAGETTGSILPGSNTGFESTYSDGGSDGFLAIVSADGKSVLSSTYFGGSGRDNVEGIAYTDAGIFVSGTTWSTDLPVTDISHFGGFNGGSDAFVAQFSHDLSELLYASYVGGSGNDQGRALAVHTDGTVAFGGATLSADYPTINAYDGALTGRLAASLTILTAAAPVPPPVGSIIKITASARLYLGGADANIKINGNIVDTISVTADRWLDEENTFHIDALIDLTATDTIEIEYINDLESSSGNRNLFIQGVAIDGVPLDLGDGAITSATGSYNPDWDIIYLGTNGSAVFGPGSVTPPPPPPPAPTGSVVSVTASSRLYQGGADAVIKVDGVTLGTVTVDANRWNSQTQTFTFDAGVALDATNVVEIEYINDFQDSGGNRNLFLHEVAIDGIALDMADADLTAATASYNADLDILYLGTNGSAVFGQSGAAQPPAANTIMIEASSRLYQGGAEANVLVDGNIVETIQVNADRWANETETFHIDAGFALDGSEEIEIEYFNDLQSGSGNRNLFIHDVAAGGQDLSLSMADRTASVSSYNSDLDIIYLGTNGSAVFAPPTPGQGSTITVIATANPYLGAAEADVIVNGTIAGSIAVSADRTLNELDTFQISVSQDAEDIQTIEIEFTNDFYQPGLGDRNLVIDEIMIDGIELDESLVDITPGRGDYYASSSFVTLWANGSAIFDMALQDDLFGV